MSKSKTAIVVTETLRVQVSGSGYRWLSRSIVLPVSRIAKAEPVDMSAITRIADAEVPPASRLTLRTPEDYLMIAESPARLAALMNGEA